MYDQSIEAQADAKELLIAARRLQKDRADLGIPMTLVEAVHNVAKPPKSGAAVPAATSAPVLGLHVTAAVTAAIDAGKVLERNRDWATDYCRRDFAGFNAFVAAAPILAVPASDAAQTTAASTSAELATGAQLYQASEAANGRKVSWPDAVNVVAMRRRLRPVG